MRHRALALLLLAAPAAWAQSGTVKGEVHITTVSSDGNRTEKKDRSDVLVYIPDFKENVPPGPPAKMRQENKRFKPSVLPIYAGQTVDFENDDALVHNVFSNSRAAHFDLGKYKYRSKGWRFTEPGLVNVYCDIHESMVATILVLPNHSFARTEENGLFELKNVPPGKHTVYAWLRDAEPVSAELTVSAGENPKLTLRLEEHPVPEHPHRDKYGESYERRTHAY